MLPQEFETRMKQMLGAEYEAFIKSYDKEKQQALRLNPLKTTAAEFLKQAPFTLRKVPWAEEGYYYSSTDTPGKHPYHDAGVYYIQDKSWHRQSTLKPCREIKSWTSALHRAEKAHRSPEK